MEFNNFQEKEIFLSDAHEVSRIKSFLLQNGLQLEGDLDYTMALYDEDKIIGTGSFASKVLKCIAVDDSYKGFAISNRIVSHLVNEEYRRGNHHLFIFTKPENYPMFKDMGFYKVAEVASSVVLLENKHKGIQGFINKISQSKREGQIISSIVVNCNPFTLGHQYLIEKASKESDFLHIFVVWEDRSSFPAQVRYDLIKEGTKHLSNVCIHKGEDYIISNATFPSYFLKDDTKVMETHCQLDLKIFGEYIAPALNINKRFVGEEPYCAVTRLYNETMKRLLPTYHIEVVEIPRLNIEENIVSASKIRAFIRQDDFNSVKRFVPKTTYDFLTSGEAESIIRKIKSEYKRH